MSGGSFNYLYCKDEMDMIYYHIHDLVDMANRARDYIKDDFADELEKYYQDLMMFERMILNRQKRLAKLMKSFEWWMSSDTSEEDFDKDWLSFLEGKVNENIP